MVGYAHPGYAYSLREYGDPIPLPLSGGWALKRPIPGAGWCDAIGCYPLFCCERWSALEKDLWELEGQLVSLALVADPFGDFAISDLRRCFPDVMIPFKEHFVADLRARRYPIVSKHHARNVRKAQASLQIEPIECPEKALTTWVELYRHLIERHEIRGIRAFSPAAFEAQLRLPGCVVFQALNGEESVAMSLWMEREDVAYYHLGASSAAGYQLRAMFGLFWAAFEYFRERQVAVLDLGAGAGLRANGSDGLARFKRGWATETRTAYFCGRVLDQTAYAAIAAARAVPAVSYFPSYRWGEFS